MLQVLLAYEEYGPEESCHEPFLGESSSWCKCEGRFSRDPWIPVLLQPWKLMSYYLIFPAFSQHSCSVTPNPDWPMPLVGISLGHSLSLLLISPSSPSRKWDEISFSASSLYSGTERWSSSRRQQQKTCFLLEADLPAGSECSLGAQHREGALAEAAYHLWWVCPFSLQGTAITEWCRSLDSIYVYFSPVISLAQISKQGFHLARQL